MSSERQVTARESSISLNECKALQYLKAAGHSQASLRMMFGVSEQTISLHANKTCTHPDITEPVTPDPPLGDELRAFRDEHNLTQRDLANMVGTSGGMISKWEHGKKKPSNVNAWRLHRAINEVENR